MTTTKRPMPPLPNPLPADFSILQFWCEWKGLDYAKEKEKAEAGMNRRSTLGSLASVNGHNCKTFELEPPASKRQARLLKTQSLPIPCPFCASLTREQQVNALMELLFDAIVEVSKGVVEGSRQ